VADLLASCGVLRYALSFDGLVTKINHHRSVSEYFTAPEMVARLGIDRLVRLGIGIEDADDLIACLNWTLHHAR
jgi:cystathionine beta-lyase/cystathionine gamma-synthase